MLNKVIRRLSGEHKKVINNEIKQIISRRELFAKIKAQPYYEKSDIFYLDWFIDHFNMYEDNYINARKLQKYLPLLLMPKNKAEIIKNTRDTIIKNAKAAVLSGDYITCKQIRLPKPISDKDAMYLEITVCDMLLPYAIEEYGEDFYFTLLTLLDVTQSPFGIEGPYEYKNVRLNENDIVIDAGANMGWFAAVVSAKAGVSHSFEPVPFIRENYLVKTAELNKNIIIHDYALSDKKSEMKLHYDNKDSVSATLVDYR
ncbi:MAG: hypothetical protein LBC73_01200, partial [Oscillospiraceae bacterium]|nr:hypothetical protein [Oscillospiraceae bacterium]